MRDAALPRQSFSLRKPRSGTSALVNNRPIDQRAQTFAFFNQTNLPRAIACAQRNRHALSVLSCRIDEFEWANGRYGYEVGDEAAYERSSPDSRNCIRKNIDWLARVGTDRVHDCPARDEVQGRCPSPRGNCGKYSPRFPCPQLSARLNLRSVLP